MHRLLRFGCVILVTSCTLAQAEDLGWVNSVLPERAYDFGTVARGSQIRHSFPVVNRTNSEIRIVSWRVKCGCTDVKIGAMVIPPGTQTNIEATVDTTKFQGPKASGLTIIFDRPAFVEADLNLSCFIRSDIVMNPGQIDFGIVSRSEKLPSASLVLTYAGGSADWRIEKMKTQTDRIKAVLQPLAPSADGQLNYNLTATIQPGVPNGYFREEITLVTNDQTVPSIPISVLANVRSAVSVTPTIINFGQVKPGETVSKIVLVSSRQPFEIKRIASSQDGLRPADGEKGSRPLHRVNLTFKAPEQPGPYHATVKIETDLKDEPAAHLKTFATVSP